jgi:hypothetical protein
LYAKHNPNPSQNRIPANKEEKHLETEAPLALTSMYTHRASELHEQWACIDWNETPDANARKAPECQKVWKLD